MAKTAVNQLVRMRAKPESETEARQILEDLVAQTRAEERPASFDLFQSKTDSTLFTIYEAWDSKEALDRHGSSPHFQSAVAKMGDLVAERSSDGKPFVTEQLIMLSDRK